MVAVSKCWAVDRNMDEGKVARRSCLRFRELALAVSGPALN
jgi:hypothetical protein